MGNIGGVSFEPTVDKFTGRGILRRVRVEAEGKFQTLRAAENILRREEYDIGTMIHPYPTPFLRRRLVGFSSTWKTITKEEKQLMKGIIIPLTSGGYREGALEIVYFI